MWKNDEMALSKPEEVESAVNQFVKAVRQGGQEVGFKEARLTIPTHDLIKVMSKHVGEPGELVNESPVSVSGSSIGTPDILFLQKGLLRLVVELKAPNKGADPTAFTVAHDRDQWKSYSQLPNIVYTNGSTWTLWRFGVPIGQPLEMCEDITDFNSPVVSDAQKVYAFFKEALAHDPPSITSTKQLAEQAARCCRALRADVGALPEETLASLTSDWREVLFPELENGQFIDAYTQTVAFALIAASGLGIELSLDVNPKKYDRLGLLLHHAAEKLGSERGVLGKSLSLLTSDPHVRSGVAASLEATVALAASLDWTEIRSSGGSDDWMDFYETFLADYDPDLRKQSGSYYTPRPVVEWMTKFTDKILVDLLGLRDGYASENVTVIDPALGTGTYLVGVMDRIAETVTERVGPGQVAAAMKEALADRVIGFEMQACPYAVAQLRLVESLKARDQDLTPAEPAVFLTDTLADPTADTRQQMLFMKPITESREQADEIKRDVPVKVVIGNPPYLSGAPQNNWVTEKLLADWRPPKDWGVSAHTKNLSNLYVYFWRWAAWKVFENSGSEGDQAGIVSFIAPTGWLDGDGFQQMRAWLSEWCSHIWILDLSPEGHQAPASTQVFGSMRQPVAIVTAVRWPEHHENAIIRHYRVPAGDRESKFADIADIADPCHKRWEVIGTDHLDKRGPWTPAASQQWQQMPAVEDLLPWHASGMMIGRTWPVAPDRDILHTRYKRLLMQPTDEEMARHLNEHKRDRTIHTDMKDDLTAACHKPGPLTSRQPPAVAVVEYGHRSFDRQYVIRDKRLINQPNPSLWAAHSDSQIHLAVPALDTANKRPKIAASKGQVISFSAHIPDMHHLDSEAGRIHPLWRDHAAATTNTNTVTLNYLSSALARQVTGDDVFAYIAAVAAHPGFTEQFRRELPNAKKLRVPLTKNSVLFAEAVKLGRRVLYLSTFGKRFAPLSAPHGCPRAHHGPKLLTPIPNEVENITHNSNKQMLIISGHTKDGIAQQGTIANVSDDVFTYSTATMNVLKSWFKYRCRNPGSKRTSPLDNLVPESWTTGYTNDLIDMLHVLTLLVAEQPKQSKLLDKICAEEQITRTELEANGALPVTMGTKAKPPPFGQTQPTLHF